MIKQEKEISPPGQRREGHKDCTESHQAPITLCLSPGTACPHSAARASVDASCRVYAFRTSPSLLCTAVNNQSKL